MKQTKKDIFDNFKKGKISDDFSQSSEMYYAMYAYEIYGDATRDNSFKDLVDLGKDLINETN